MRRGSKTLIAAVAVLALVVGLMACGGSDSSSTATQEQTSSSSGSSEDFTPKHHDDSGGGSKQFLVKGGDNSVQEFGAEADASEFEQAAADLHGFLDARAAGDGGAACSYLSGEVAESLESLVAKAKHLKDASCAKVLGELTNPAATGELRTEAAKADVGSLRIEGDRAFLIYRGAGGAVLAMPMVKEGGAWKVSSLTGTRLN